MRSGNNKMWKMLLVTLMLLALVGGCGKQEQEEIPLEEVQVELPEETKEEIPEEASSVFVHVCGAVASAGVYELAADSRIFEAITAAGGLTEVAAPDSLNQAEKVTDGQRIYVPSVEDVQNQIVDQVAEGDAGASVTEDGRVNINQASAQELMTLTGIGEKKAEAIIQYRENQGPFQSVEDLMKVAGIKEGTFEKIKEQIRV